MPADTSSSGNPNLKPSTRSSIRLSLNLAGKAFADVINKEGRDPDKSAKKAKDNSSRRLSAIGRKPSAPRSSMENSKVHAQNPRRVGTPESKTITSRRMSVAGQKSYSEDQPSKPVADSVTPQATGITRSSTIRPRNNGVVSSALPKYRPKSVLMELAKLPSPRTGTRRRFSSSDEEKEDRREKMKADIPSSPSEKNSRPISPLPQRAVLKTNMINATLLTSPSKIQPATPSTSKVSPTRPSKCAKTTSSVAHSGIPRPSSSSSSSSPTPHTPKTPSIKGVSAIRRSAQDKGSPSRASIHGSPPESPLARRSRNGSPFVTSAGIGNMSHISEANSEDSEDEAVEILLAPVAPLGAPTPAMPKIQTRSRNRDLPQTPTRTNLLPTRENMSYISPLPPSANNSGSSLRPPQQRQPGSDRAPRGSILSWEQLASEASRTLGEDEIEHMLSEIPAPFRSSGPASPTLTTQIDIPESPCLSALNSPGGYGSISQVLLPDVTPSPAIHHNAQRYDMGPSSEIPAVDAAIVTLLRLQLAAVENTAKERLYQLQYMEEEIHKLKEARMREVQEMTKQVSYMEEQVRSNLEWRGQVEEERTVYLGGLDDQLRQAQAICDKAVQQAVAHTLESVQASQDAVFKSQRAVRDTVCSARVAASEWASVHEASEMELDIVRGDRQVLSVLLDELDRFCQVAL